MLKLQWNKIPIFSHNINLNKKNLNQCIRKYWYKIIALEDLCKIKSIFIFYRTKLHEWFRITNKIHEYRKNRNRHDEGIFLFQKHLGLTLDNRLTFHKYLRYVSNKISKTIELLRNLHNIQGQHFLQYINVSGGSMCNLLQSTWD